LAGKITTLYIDGSSLRLMVSRGKRVVEWAYLPLEKDLFSDNTVAREAELALKIEQLLKTRKHRSRNVYVCISGLHCISRPMNLPKLPKDMMNEAVKREASRVLPVPLEQMSMTWKEMPSLNNHTQVFAVAVPNVTADTVVKTIQHAGLKPDFLGIKPLVLAGTVTAESAIIVDVQSTEFDIIIMTGGVPQTIRSIAFPDGEVSLEDKSGTVINELARTISFFNANSGEVQLTPDVPIYASGELYEKLGFQESLTAFSERPVMPLPSPVNSREGFNPHLYSPNLCLIAHLLDGGSNGKEDSSFIVQNSLPAQYLPQPVSLVNVLSVPAAVIVLGLIAVLVTNNLLTAGQIRALQSRVDSAGDTLQARLLESQQISGEISGLRTDISGVGSARDSYGLIIDDMKTQSYKINGGLSELIKRLPVTVALYNIRHTADALELEGVAETEKDILLYINKLETSQLFGEITVTGMAKNEAGKQNFTLYIDTSRQGGGVSGIDVILRYFPADVSLVSLGQSGDVTTITANAPDEESIVLFLEELEKSGLFRDITLQSQVSGQNGGIDFVFTVGEI
jgi:type IV pilus assembly protein PilM